MKTLPNGAPVGAAYSRELSSDGPNNSGLAYLHKTARDQNVFAALMEAVKTVRSWGRTPLFDREVLFDELIAQADSQT